MIKRLTLLNGEISVKRRIHSQIQTISIIPVYHSSILRNGTD